VGELGLRLLVNDENHCLMNLMGVVVCDAQAWRTFLMLVWRLFVRRGVDLGCERSFLVRFCSVPFVRIVGFGLRFGTVTCFSLVVFDWFFLSVVIALPRNALVAMNFGMAGVV